MSFLCIVFWTSKIIIENGVFAKQDRQCSIILRRLITICCNPDRLTNWTSRPPGFRRDLGNTSGLNPPYAHPTPLIRPCGWGGGGAVNAFFHGLQRGAICRDIVHNISSLGPFSLGHMCWAMNLKGTVQRRQKCLSLRSHFETLKYPDTYFAELSNLAFIFAL
jgi:hypothetical protein